MKSKRPVENATEHPTAEVNVPARNAQALSAGVPVETVANIAANLVCAYANNTGGSSTQRVVGNLDDFTLDQIARQAVRLIRTCGNALLQMESQRSDTTGEASHRHYEFDEALKLIFPHMSKSRREKLYRDFLRYGFRLAEAERSGQSLDTITERYHDEVAKQLNDDRRLGIGFLTLSDAQQWRKTQVSKQRRTAGKKGALASVRKRRRKKHKFFLDRFLLSVVCHFASVVRLFEFKRSESLCDLLQLRVPFASR